MSERLVTRARRLARKHPSYVAWRLTVVARGRAMLDETVPLARGSHRDVVSYSVEGANLLVRLRDGTSTGLARLAQFAGYRDEASAPSAVRTVGMASE